VAVSQVIIFDSRLALCHVIIYATVLTSVGTG